MMRQKLVIWGCGGHGREVLSLCEDLGFEVVGFLDERPEMKGRVVTIFRYWGRSTSK
jgi:hypothetical protein